MSAFSNSPGYHVHYAADGVRMAVDSLCWWAAHHPKEARENLVLISEAGDKLSELIAKLRRDDLNSLGEE